MANIHPKYKLFFVSDDKGYQDTGDATSNESFWRIATFNQARNHPLSDLEFIRVVEKDGVVIRSPDDKFLKDPKFTVSRDQTLMFLTFAAYCGYSDTLKRCFKHLRKNFFQYDNADIGFLELGCVGLRGRWFTWIFDLWLIGNTALCVGWFPQWKHDDEKKPWFWKFRWRPDDEVGDDKLHIALLWLAFSSPTWASNLATKLYFKNRPNVYKEPNPAASWPAPYQAMLAYFDAGTGNSPEIAWAWREHIRTMSNYVKGA